MDTEYTRDWFSWAPPVWEQLIPFLPGQKSFLEIGSFEGRSAVWTIEHMMEDGGEIYCIDTWKGGEEHTEEEIRGAKFRFNKNISAVREKFPDRKVVSCTGTSTSWLAALIQDKHQFDFIYIDGSHLARDVMTDACMAWPLLREGGLLVFDDYLWGYKAPNTKKPKIAIDFFMTLFEEDLQIVHIGYQFIVRKVK